MILLDDTYSRIHFLHFLEEDFLPDFIRDIRPAETPEHSSIQKAYSLGRSKSLGLPVFEFTFEGSPHKRVTLTKDAFKIMRSYAEFQALAIFHSLGNNDWRLSLMTATTEKTQEGKVALAYSNPKRFSFFLGPNAKIKTPSKFLMTQGRVVDFEDLRNRFSIEVVNKEFYKEISELFTQLVGGSVYKGNQKQDYEALLKLPGIPDKSQTALEFAVRLIGRVIFCWFLREKKSDLGKSLVPNNLLSLEAVKNNPDYYHTILEPIFFEVLNKPLKLRKLGFTQEPFSSIPYLNGGLFSPQDDDFFSTNESKQAINQNVVIIPDEWLRRFFAVLETYNFTIDENTSFDEELSIDPEMLGRIFENLLAEINPETGESARKSTGSYYTPRLIVDYMVDECLLLYLKNQTHIDEEKLRAVISYDLHDDDEYQLTTHERERIINALEKVKILDPACGSGAFPIGALQKIVFILQQTDPEGHLWFKRQIKNTPPELRKMVERELADKNFDYVRKLGIIRENIYGVDIQPIATEISRLRCFLTLVVDQRINENLDDRGIEPLPNLDFKFVTANSLIGLPQLDQPNDKPQQLQIDVIDDREKINELKDIRDQYFTSSGIEREQLKTAFVMAQKKLVNQLIEEHGYMGVVKAELTQKLTNWEPFTHKPTSWFDPEWMFGIKDGFDIVIANPPYVQFQKLEIIFREILRRSPHYESQSDLWYFFVYKAYQLLKDGGILTFIVSNYFLQAGHAETLRKFITNNFRAREITNFTDNYVFENVGVHSLIMILEKGETLDYDMQYYECDNIHTLMQRNGKSLNINKSALGKTWLIVSSIDSIIMNKLLSQGVKLASFSKISNGIKSGEDSIFILNNNADTGNYAEEQLLRNYLKNSDIHRFYINEPSKKIIYSCSDTFLDDYPVFKLYISKYKERLENKWSQRGEVNDFWRLYRPREDIFKSNKPLIVTPYRTNKIGFALSMGCLSGTDTYVILNGSNSINEFVLLALLNSKLIRWFYERIGKKKGKIFEIATKELSAIPIIFPNEAVSNKLTELTKDIIETETSIHNLKLDTRAVYKRIEL